jgi:hypothetical protein
MEMVLQLQIVAEAGVVFSPLARTICSMAFLVAVALGKVVQVELQPQLTLVIKQEVLVEDQQEILLVFVIQPQEMAVDMAAAAVREQEL